VVEAALSPPRGRRGLIVVWLLLGVLTVAIGALEWTDYLRATSGGAGGADPRLLLPVPPSELGAIEIADAVRLHRFERGATGAWFYHGAHGGAEGPHLHDPDPARADRIARAFAAFGRTRVERDFPLGRDGAAYGIAAPELVILIYRPGQSQPLVQYAVGHLAPDTVSRYMTVVGHPVVVTIPAYQIDNLRALVQAVGGAPEPGASAAGRR
jgi:hypothetical protein